MTIVEAFKRMQVVQHEEPEDVAEENGELDQQVSHMHSASIAHFLRLSILLLWI
jgi:coatomer subunit beta'